MMNLDFVRQMGEVEMGSELKRILKSLCRSNGWCYGVFWSFDKRNSMLLILEDAYYEEQMATVVGNMLPQVHTLGEGIIGEVAVTGKHKWIFSDTHRGGWNSISSRDVLDYSDFCCQFSSRIQTIAVVPVESQGVVQFGSTQKMSESMEFLDHTRRLFQEMENFDGLVQLENTPPSLNGESYDLNEIFASILTSGSCFTENLASALGDNSRELMGNHCSLANLIQSATFALDIDCEMMNPLDSNSPFLSNQSQATDREFLQSTSSVKTSVTNTTCISTWSEEGLILTSLEQPFPLDSMIQQSLQGESMLTSMHGTEGLMDMKKTVPKMMDNRHSAQLFLENEDKFPEIANSLQRLTEDLSDYGTDLSSSYTIDDLSKWFTHSPDHSFHKLGTSMNNMNNNLLQSGAAPVSTDIPIKHPCNSVQSSRTYAFTSHCQEKFNIVHDAEKDLFEGLGLDSVCAQTDKNWEDYTKPSALRGGGSAHSTSMSECITELDVVSATGPRKGLFSELGLEELLKSASNPFTKCNLEEQLSTTKRRKVESSSSNSNHVQWTKLPCSAGSTSFEQAVCNEETNNLVCKNDVPKSQVGLRIDDSYSINAEKAVAASPKESDKPAKVSRKRARPGESTRPRPKDRQQIQDRLKELRGIIPNGAKCSIDSLLDLTIKHMLFLQSITKYADKLKAAEEPKLVGEQNRAVLKDNSAGGHNGGGGATWAYEIGGQTMICPIIVEDLNPPGQMLIEMLCEDRGFFLEIGDMIRGFGLNIWKGVMERQEDKIWARFVVEANRHVTRMDIFWSLVQLLQQANTNTTDSMNQPKSEMDDRIPLLDSYQQTLLPIAAALSHQLG